MKRDLYTIADIRAARRAGATAMKKAVLDLPVDVYQYVHPLAGALRVVVKDELKKAIKSLSPAIVAKEK